MVDLSLPLLVHVEPAQQRVGRFARHGTAPEVITQQRGQIVEVEVRKDLSLFPIFDWHEDGELVGQTTERQFQPDIGEVVLTLPEGPVTHFLFCLVRAFETSDKLVHVERSITLLSSLARRRIDRNMGFVE